MLLRAIDTARDLKRVREIASVLVRNGFGDLAHRLGTGRKLKRALDRVRGRPVAEDDGPATPERLSAALDQLGPTFVKLGQVLAGRSDLLPREWTEALGRLHEHAAPVPWDAVRAQLEEDLGAPPEEVFRDLDPSPLASASIAQVHAARLQDGTDVVLKVRRPGIRSVVEADLRLLARLAERLERERPEMARFRPRAVIRELDRSLRSELDLSIEARNSQRIAAAMADVDELVIPRIHGEWTTERLCVQDRLVGISASEWLETRPNDSIDPAKVASLGADLVLRMVFVDGLYHADPHAGNVFFLEDGRIGLIDFGMVGRLSRARRMEFLRLLGAVVEQHEEDAVDLLLTWAGGDEEPDLELLNQDCSAFIDRWNGLPLVDIDTAELLRDVAALVRRNGLILPADVAMLIKLVITLDGLGVALDPSFRISDHVEPFVEAALDPRNVAVDTAKRTAREATRALAELPHDLRGLLRSFRGGRPRLELELRRLDRFGQRMVHSANRITMGLVTAALIIGTAISLNVPGGLRILGLPVFGTIGFATSVIAGAWLLWSIIRSGRRR
jgi:ubiquinone biosynthesis protein